MKKYVLTGFGEPNMVSIKTGIIGAMDEEIDSLKSAVKSAKTKSIGNMEFCEGSPTR